MNLIQGKGIDKIIEGASKGPVEHSLKLGTCLWEIPPLCG